MVQSDKPKKTIWRKRISCWIPEVTNTHSESVILILFHLNNDHKNAPQCNVIRTGLLHGYLKSFGRIISSSSARTFSPKAYMSKIILSYKKKTIFQENCYSTLPFIYAVILQPQTLHQQCTVSNKAKKERLFSFISIIETVIQITILFMDI